MLLNHERRTPRDWDDACPSLCPDCRSPLLARRGRVVVWHWAHRSVNAGRIGFGCSGEETPWHLAWKTVYHRFPGWEVEVPYRLAGNVYRLDAARLSGGRVREFVHSLSDRYIAKHLALAQAGLDVLWIFDGDAFGAARARKIRRGGLKHLLKPKARWLHSHIGGLVHCDDRLWREWKADCWYPLETERCAGMVSAFNRILREYQEAP